MSYINFNGEFNLNESCGIVGIYSEDEDTNVASNIYYALYALQHRGQESAGIATHNGEEFNSYRGMGLLPDVFRGNKLDELKGNVGIGHVRYSTNGTSAIENSQPFSIDFIGGKISIATNGDIINSSELRKTLIDEGVIFESDSDAELMCYLLKDEYYKTKDLFTAIENFSNKLLGSFASVILVNDEVYAVRDFHGMKPFSLAKKDDVYMVASESVAFDVLGMKHLKDIAPGEILHLNSDLDSVIMKKTHKCSNALCMFEFVYFARSDSIIEGKSVYQTRLDLGRALAKQFPADADVVMAVPDSSISSAIGFSRESGLPYGEGLMKNRYVGRTFIMPTQEEREIAVKLKINTVKSELQGKKIILVDDSIVRGTTSRSLIKIIKEAGVEEIHLRIACPPVIAPCFYGVSMASKDELIAVNHSTEEIKEMLGVDSLEFIDMDSLIQAIGLPRDELCMGCISEEYPTEVPKF